MWNGSPAIQVNWITSCARSAAKAARPRRRKDEREQHHAGADQLDQDFSGERDGAMIVIVAMIVTVSMRP